jgi:hypothetical protein
VEAGGSLITERNVDVIVLTPNSSVRNKRSGFASIFLMFVLENPLKDVFFRRISRCG